MMIDKKEMYNFIEWACNTEFAWEIPGDYADNEFWDIVGEDRAGLENILGEMKPRDLAEISGLFDDIYEKWPDEKMDKFLNKLKKKIEKAGYYW